MTDKNNKKENGKAKDIKNTSNTDANISENISDKLQLWKSSFEFKSAKETKDQLIENFKQKFQADCESMMNEQALQLALRKGFRQQLESHSEFVLNSFKLELELIRMENNSSAEMKIKDLFVDILFTEADSLTNKIFPNLEKRIHQQSQMSITLIEDYKKESESILSKKQCEESISNLLEISEEIDKNFMENIDALLESHRKSISTNIVNLFESTIKDCENRRNTKKE